MRHPTTLRARLLIALVVALAFASLTPAMAVASISEVADPTAWDYLPEVERQGLVNQRVLLRGDMPLPYTVANGNTGGSYWPERAAQLARESDLQVIRTMPNAPQVNDSLIKGTFRSVRSSSNRSRPRASRHW